MRVALPLEQKETPEAQDRAKETKKQKLPIQESGIFLLLVIHYLSQLNENLPFIYLIHETEKARVCIQDPSATVGERHGQDCASSELFSADH